MDSYTSNYTELETVGRGSFGVADLVMHNIEQKKYIAKKIMVGSLTDNEQHAALQEAELLKQLDHPFIVRYKESFIDQGCLIIIMEY